MPDTLNVHEFKIENTLPSCTWIMVGAPGSGKCLAPGTKILMYDHSVKNVEDIKIGDLIMGDDTTPRKILSTCSGNDMMYTISSPENESYVVNSEHILCLKKIYYPKVNKVDNDKFRVSWMKNNMLFERFFDVFEEAETVLDCLSENDYTVENILEIKVCDYLNNFENYTDYNGYYNTLENNNEQTIKQPYYLGIAVGYGVSKVFEIVENTSTIKEDFWLQDKYLNNEKIYHELMNQPIKCRKEFLKGFFYSSKFEEIDNYYYYTYRTEDLFWLYKLLRIARSSGIPCFIYKKYSYQMFKCYYELTIKTSSIDFKNCPSNELIYDIQVNYEGNGVYYGFEITGNGRFMLHDLSVTHNTTLMENLCYYLKHRYPVARGFVGTDGGYKRFSNIFHPLYMSNYYNEDEEKRHIHRQILCEQENGKKYLGNYAINILDDISDDPKIYKTKVFRSLFKMGSQHWHQMCMVGTQYSIDMPPDIRKSVSYVALFYEPEHNERKKLYENFGGLLGTFDEFCEILDQVTEKFTCLIIKKRNPSRNKEENIFYYKLQDLQSKFPSGWRFGCNEYRRWGEQRYNTSYKDVIMI